MKTFFKVSIFVTLYFLVPACSQSITPISSPSRSPSATPTLTPSPSQTATATIEPTSRPEYAPPTLIPTMDPTLVPGLLKNAFSIQTWPGLIRYQIRQITGWDYGFGGGFWQGSCSGYYWLDTNHLLLYPAAGQVRTGDQWSGIGVVPQPVVINTQSGYVWLPPANESASPLTCNKVYWSRELAVLITSEIHDNISTVSTYTYDGDKQASYPGGLWDVSPSGTKIRIAEDTLLDLRTNKKIQFDWPRNDKEVRFPRLYWNDDETRVYRCCYYFGDVSTGKGYSFEMSELWQPNGDPGPDSILPHEYGDWVRNDTYFLVEWSWVDDGDIRYLPMFSLTEKKYYDVRKMAGIPGDWYCLRTVVSPDGKYVWMEGDETSYLVNLMTFKAVAYLTGFVNDFTWSPNSKFAWLYSSDPANETKQYFILSAADKKIRPLPLNPSPETYPRWNPTGDILVYHSENKQSLIFLDTSTMTFRELTLYFGLLDLVWSPNGEKIVFAAGDGRLWEVYYPKLDNLARITSPFYKVDNLQWSPDSTSLAFTSGPDIYIAESVK